MIVTRKHLPRRTFLERHGRRRRASGAGCDDAGVCRVGPAREGAGPPRVHLRAQRHRHGRLDAEGGRPRLRVFAHPEAAREVPRGHARAVGTRAQERIRARRRSRRPRARRRLVPDRRAPAKDRRRGHPERDLGRPGRRAAARLADALRLARDRLRRLTHGRQLRLGLFVRVHEQPRVARSGDADAAGNQSAPGIRAPVRRHRHQPSSRRPGAPPALPAQHPRPRRRAHGRARRRSRVRPTSASSTSICRRSARSSSASSAPRRT